MLRVIEHPTNPYVSPVPILLSDCVSIWLSHSGSPLSR